MMMHADCPVDSLIDSADAVGRICRGRSDLVDHAEAQELDIDEIC